MYEIHEINGLTHQDTIEAMNALVPETFPVLEQRHFQNGFWWLAFLDTEAVGFAGLVPFEPFPNIGYCKRCYIAADHHGHGLQFRLLAARTLKARQLGYTHLVAECAESNGFSSNNLRKSGFDLCEPEQKWGSPNSLYWVRAL